MELEQTKLETKKPNLGELLRVKWDLVKIQEPNGLDAGEDKKFGDQIGSALAQGFEPFAIVPFMSRATSFSQPTVTNWIYFKRPSSTDEVIDESGKVLRL